MEEKLHRSPRSKATHEASYGGPAGNNSRFAVIEDGGDSIECSGKHCRSCTAGLIADCVALCCCPFAVLHCFALAFVKAPLMAGRKCCGLAKKNRKKTGQKIQRSLSKRSIGYDVVLERNRDGNAKKEFDETDQNGNCNASFETEKVWLELYQIGHLEFGRISFTGD